MDEGAFLRRTKSFALAVIKLTEGLRRTVTASVMGRQLLRSGMSVGANYRSACRAKSRADMSHKLAIVEEELDESAYWMELLVESGQLASRDVDSVLKEAHELLAMTVASRRTLARPLDGAKIENRKSKIENSA